MLSLMKMKEIPTTSPFEDLILGSQFVPVLARTNSIKSEKGERGTQKNIGIFQCRKCGANFFEEEEALTHYKSHVLETHKEYFSVVFGGLCSKKGCVFVQRKDPSIHFHCSHCRFSACEILDLPLHMEKQHLSFYKEVSLVLSKEDAQLNKVYRCGECDLSIQGKVSIVHHLLTHEAASPATPPSTPADSMELTSEKSLFTGSPNSPTPLVNGVTNHNYALNGEDGRLEKRAPRIVSPSSQEQIQVEINPLDLLSTILEEDMRSDNPVLPTQHFLLGHTAGSEERYSDHYLATGYEDCSPGEIPSSFADSYPVKEEPELPNMNGLGAVTESAFYESAAPGVFQCGQCSEAFKYQYLLTAHRKQRHEGSVVTPFRCCVCGNEFTALSDLKRHAIAAGHATDLSHFCPVCGHTFVAAADLKQHLIDHDKNNRRPSGSALGQPQPKEGLVLSSVMEKTICDGCSQEFPSKSELTRHIVKYQGTCNPNKTDSLRCATCGDEMPTLEALKEHRRLAHPPSPTGDSTRTGIRKGFQCDYCGKNFSCRSNLRDHLVVHTGEKPYPCDICGKAFSFIHNMKTHRLTHNEGRNEMCPYCDKAYKSKISLYYHMKKGNCRGLSTKEVPEGFRRCTECLQMFASEERFQNHKTKGTCQMSYRCIHCGIRCSTQDKLEKHLQKGNCTKTSGASSPSSERQRRRAAARRRAEEEPVCCERCNNYNRDCCCTFSCGKCGKRVFSIGAFIGHKRLHLRPHSPGEGPGCGSSPVAATSTPLRPPKTKERIIRPSFIERRRRKKKRRGGNKGAKKKTPNIPLIPPLEAEAEEEKGIEAVNSSVVHEPPSSPTDISSTAISPSDLAPITPNAAIPSLGEDALHASSLPPTPAEPVGEELEEEEEEEEDSNSGSLTDLSPFTAPNLLLKPTPPVGGSGQG